MKSLADESRRREIVERAGRVSESSPALWGKMSAGAMMAHLAQGMRMAYGDIPVAPIKVPVRFFPLKQLAIYVLPFPKGLPTAPELQERSAEPIEDSRREVVRLVDEFGRRKTFDTPHPAFGRLSPRAWGVLTYRHCDHHLRQFGV